jgi:hypothetical protein
VAPTQATCAADGNVYIYEAVDLMNLSQWNNIVRMHSAVPQARCSRLLMEVHVRAWGHLYVYVCVCVCACVGVVGWVGMGLG